MRLTNDRLTLFNAWYDKAQDCTVYKKTVITGISWYSTVKTNVGDTGLKSANMFIVRIPVEANTGGKSYTSPGAFDSAENVDSLFTLRQGDVIVKGTVSGLITTPAQAHKAYPDAAFTVMSVTDNRRALHARHWKVVGA